MLRGAQPMVVQLSGPGWPSVPSTPPPRRMPAQGPTEEVPGPEATSTPSFTPPPGPGRGLFPAPPPRVSASASACSPDLSHSPGPGPGWPGEEGGVIISLFSSSSLTAEGSLATGFLCGKQAPSLIPFPGPSAGWSRPPALTTGPFLLGGRKVPRRDLGLEFRWR